MSAAKTKTVKDEAVPIDVSSDTLVRLAELGRLFDEGDPGAAIDTLVAMLYADWIERKGRLPEGWAFRGDINRRHILAYYDEYDADKWEIHGMWHEFDRTVQSAIRAGWFATPDIETAAAEFDVISPRAMRALAAAVNERYIELTSPDPNSWGPSPTM